MDATVVAYAVGDAGGVALFFARVGTSAEERARMSGWFVKLVMSVALVIGLLLPLRAAEQASVIVVAGAGGNDDYAGLFTDWAADWASAARIAEAKLTTIGSGKQDSVEK